MSTLQGNIERAQEYLQRFKEQGVLNHINGESTHASSGDTFETLSPIDLKPLAKVARGGLDDIDRAVKASQEAFKTWSKTPGKERRAILIKVAEAIEARAEEIAFTECMDTGQALRFMSKAAIRGAANFRYFADKAPQAEDGQALRNDTQMNVTSKRPLGPVGVITPWNTPFMLSTWKIAPALASGCTVVHKPAEFSPMTAKLLVEIAEEAGLPKGVLNLVNGFGEDAGKALTEHPGIKAIAFVGESRTGQMIMAQAAPTLKRFHFELGGKNPVIVFDDADIDRAVNAASFMIYSLNGERCTSSSRLLVQESIYEEVTRRVADIANNAKVGHPLDPETVVGPLIHPEHEQKVLSYFEKAREQGATIAAGGMKVGEEGCFVRPTLFTNATNDMVIAQEEIFGPVLTAIPFKDEEEALSIANDTQYGLAAYLWTNDLNRAMRLTDALEAGMIWVNSENVRHLPAPFGGVKASGIGRDGGDWSFDFYMETVNVSFPRKTHQVPNLGSA
ncbi:5-carboxymethyl-2-hydroxymuconate semialdehyde dehydrogenase [Vreelandella neptunia]|uniref:5-carboxymethyl-2-hydroxymuconate semialdehyde dehydrogenase n=1 Tax=Vreelandella neptunia TaxID=115551 RepID=A0ABS9SC80_9GAMM|nr:5-carboxymethyl-2-hydroxymuconate semialdehyde dehydrogenase [Halomonas neptunia]MCH4813714.1 5-carboxymethyl-2-hydroxymuconate semialdehyde dehydrogenase [Halomonas neptunia]